MIFIIDYYFKPEALEKNPSEEIIDETPIIDDLPIADLLPSEKKETATQAKERLLKEQKENPKDLNTNLELIKTYIALKDIPAAQGLINSLDTQQPKIKYYQAILKILYKDFDGAQILFSEIIEETTDKNSQKFIDKYGLFSTFKESDPLYLQTLLAKTLTEVKEYYAAIPLLFDIINEQPNYRDAWIILGYAYLQTNKIADAIDSLSSAESLDTEKPETLFLLGLAYFANNNTERAIYYIEKADKNGFEPKDQINLKLGELYLLKGKYEKAAKKFETVLDLNTSSIDVFVRAVFLNIDHLKNPEKALELAKLAAENHPKNPMTYNLLGWAYTEVSEFDKALENLEKAIEMDPDFDAAHLNFGNFYEKQNLDTLAKEYYKKAYLLGQGNDIARKAAQKYKALTP